MTSPEDLRARLRGLFSQELADHAASMARGLAGLESPGGGEPDEPLVRELFRSAHSLKGAAVSADYPQLESLCHALETALARWRDHLGPPGPAFLGALRGGVAVLEAAADALRTGRQLDAAALAVAERELAAAAPADRPASVPSRRRASPAPTPAAHGPPPAAPPALRLPAGQLDRLLDQAGEVLVASRAAGLIADAIDDALDEFTARHRHWRQLRPVLETELRVGAGDTGLGALTEADEAWAGALDVLARVADTVRSGQRALRRATATFREEVHQAGMLPFEVACEGLDVVVRDAARSNDKQAHLLVGGREVRLDRLVMSALREPLIHLVRNAADHGVEPPDVRQRAGKPLPATVAVSAELHGSEVRVAVADDGAGIDEERVRAAAAALTLPAEAELAELLFVPGLSTATATTLVSGRGVGLDVVRSSVEALGGSVTIVSSPGEGTRVELVVPSAAATLRVLVAQVSGQPVALPLAAARRVLEITGDDLRAMEGGTVLTLSERAVPVVDLATAFPRPEVSTRRAFTAMVVESGGEWAALLVDAVLTEEEVVVRPPGPRLARAPLILGVAALPSGELITVLSPAACARQGRGQPLATTPALAAPTARRVLLVEDSVTTRALERGILEGAGYEVLVAPDGLAAWRLLARDEVDLVLADVSMPNMDGLELCRRIRASARLHRLPVVLVTTLGSDEDRARGVEAGADAYIAKASFDQGALLDTIARLL